MNTDNNTFYQLAQQCLCPPGEGVFTVNTAKNKKQSLQRLLYGSTADVQQLWLNSLKTLATEEKPLLLGIPSDCGGGILRGANWGPLYIREALLTHFSPNINNDKTLPFLDLGDIRVIPHLLHDKYLNEQTIQSCRHALYGQKASTECQKLPVSPLSITERLLTDLYLSYPNKKVFSLGGDHSVSYPLLKTYLKHKTKQGIRVGILHFDAHTDLLTSRLGIDICFGSWCAHILNELTSPADLIQLGIRSSAQNKDYWQNKFGVKQHWANEIREKGVHYITECIIKHFKQHHIEEIYISFDIDAIDEQYAHATGTPEPNGLTPSQAVKIIECVGKEFKVTGADLVEVAPLSHCINEKSKEVTIKTAVKISEVILKNLLCKN